MLLIRNGHLISPADELNGYFDLLVAGPEEESAGTILKIAPNGTITPALFPELEEQIRSAKPVNATGCLIFPGLVDVHVHFRDPGFTYKEDMETGAGAATAGGVTSVVLMANTKPPVDNPETLAYVLNKGRETGIRVYTCVNVTKGMKGEELVDVAPLLKLGAVGMTDDGVPLLDENLAREAMKLSAELGVPISFHEEDPAYIENNGINHGAASEHFQIGGSDREAEISLVRRDLALALETGAIINIQHISSKETVELIRRAKFSKGGERIHAEATPHHFTLTEEAAIRCGTMAKMNPPLREEADRLAIIEGIADGTIDIIATDHAPHSEEEKAKPITEAPSGIIGLETALSLANESLVQAGYMDYAQVIRAMSVNPAKLYGLEAGFVREGGPADLVVFDPKKTWTPESFLSKSNNSPFLGKTLTGKVRTTICRGQIIV
ncbi:MAG: dihydroorotase [Lachnospiraceae bacterium]|nr:dihydroorotase [Lachnospiraceae bacterium]